MNVRRQRKVKMVDTIWCNGVFYNIGDVVEVDSYNYKRLIQMGVATRTE